MHHRLPVRSLVLVAALTLPPGAALARYDLAQYDKDGRYVPSPNGVPADPYARPVPLYPGTPGQAIGTPSLPRNAINPVPPIAPLQVPDRAPVYQYNPRPYLVRIPTEKQCRAGWSAASGLTPREFQRRCDRLLEDLER